MALQQGGLPSPPPALTSLPNVFRTHTSSFARPAHTCVHERATPHARQTLAGELDKLEEFSGLFTTKKLTNGTEVVLFSNVVGDLEVLVSPVAAPSYSAAKPELRIRSAALCRNLFEVGAVGSMRRDGGWALTRRVQQGHWLLAKVCWPLSRALLSATRPSPPSLASQIFLGSEPVIASAISVWAAGAKNLLEYDAVKRDTRKA